LPPPPRPSRKRRALPPRPHCVLPPSPPQCEWHEWGDVEVLRRDDIGWAQVRRLDVSEVVAFLVDSTKLRSSSMGWRDYGEPHGTAGMKQRLLLNLLDRTHKYHQVIERHLFDSLEPTAGGFRSMGSLPDCIALRLDEQLRAALPDVLGPQDGGDLVLGYGQLTAMGAGNTISSHVDSPKYGEVIVTVGLVGGVQVTLALKHKPVDSFSGVEILAGHAYAIFGYARHRLSHEVWCPPTSILSPECRIDAYGGRAKGAGVPARVGLTLRYFRRSFCELGLGPARVPPRHVGSVGEIVMVKDNMNPKQNPFTYPAWVLAVDEDAGTLHVAFLADGLTAERADECGVDTVVAVKDAVPASEHERRGCWPALESVSRRLWPASNDDGELCRGERCRECVCACSRATCTGT